VSFPDKLALVWVPGESASTRKETLGIRKSSAARNEGRSMKKEKKPLGAHWNQTSYSKLYQLYRRVEDVATALEKRRKGGWVPSKPYIEELFDIATSLKVLDKQVKS
jgi:hypothetical protein